jgi:hypothetical protein
LTSAGATLAAGTVIAVAAVCHRPGTSHAPWWQLRCASGALSTVQQVGGTLGGSAG